MTIRRSAVLPDLHKDRRGSVAVVFALMSLPMMGVIGTAIDFGRAITTKQQLQSIVDAAVVAGARLPATANQNRQDASEAMLVQRLKDANLTTARTEISATNAEVRITASYDYPTTILPLLGIDKWEITAVAAGRSQIENGGVACMIALSSSSSDSLHLQGINKATSENCWTWINSAASTSINAVGASIATAQGFCTVGGVIGQEHFHPTPYTGCEAMADPFASKFAQNYPDGSCSVSNLELKKGVHTLSPGVYCGGIRIRVQADVTMQPGVYLIKDGELLLDAQAKLQGQGVTILFRGSNTRLEVNSGADFVVKAPASGAYAGFVLVDRRLSSASAIRESVVQGGGRINIEGILYAPQWKMNISGNGDINQESKYFAMIADTFYMEGNGKIYIKSDAAAAGLPNEMPKIKTGPMLLL